MPRETASRTRHRPSDKPLGILGGGQLARMMILRAHSLGIPVKVLCADATEPAAQVTSDWVKGDPNRLEDLVRFFEGCRVVTFESEFMNAELLEQAAKSTNVEIYPRPKAMAILQDRLTQKKLISKNGLPTADFVEVKSGEKPIRRAFETLGGKVVFKQRRFGYDGYGTFVVRSEIELEAFIAFIAKNSALEAKSGGFIAEKFIPFERELAVMIARDLSGRTVRLPFVETHQENSRCLWVKGPLKETTRLKALGRKLEEFLEKTKYVGVMGVELFETKKGLLINELAPRVHNSGHYSLDASSVDQFSLHVRSVLDLGLPAPRLVSGGFAMMNLLGTSSETPSWRLSTDIDLHWYGKRDNRAGRKMGHYNVRSSTPESALKIALERRSDFEL